MKVLSIVLYSLGLLCMIAAWAQVRLLDPPATTEVLLMAGVLLGAGGFLRLLFKVRRDDQ